MTGIEQGTELDAEIDVMFPVQCWGEGCTRVFLPGGFGRPFTARKIITSLREAGWMWVEGKTPTNGKPLCAGCGSQEVMG